PDGPELHRDTLGIGDARESEVAEFGLLPSLIDEQVAGLDVEMKQIATVRVRDGMADVRAHFDDRSYRQAVQASVSDPFFTRRPGHVLHDEIAALLLPARLKVVHADDVVVRELKCGRSFALQSLGIGDPRSQDLDGDYAPQHEVPRQIHDRHPAASEFLEKYISFIQEWTVSVAGDCDLLPVHHLIEKDWIRCRPRRVGRVTLDF